MSRLRLCLKDEIASRLDIMTGWAPAVAIDYKKSICTLFVSNGKTIIHKRALLALCPNGEWRSSKIEHYLGRRDLAHVDLERIQEELTSGMIVALASSQPHLYNRSKWTGSDLAVDDLWMFEAVHRLLSSTFCRVAASFRPGTLAAQLLALGKSCAVYDSSMEELADVEAEGAADNEDEDKGEAESRAAGSADQAGNDSAAVAKDQQQAWILENTKHRSMALDFLRGQPLGYLVLMRVVMEPLRQYLGSQFERAADKWEFEQQAKLAKARRDGVAAGRKLRVVEVARCTDDHRMALQLRILASTDIMWAMLPPSFFTVRHRALAFRCIARLGCAHHKLLHHRHQRFPFRLFLLLDDPGRATEMSSTPECLLDPWSKKMRRLYPTFSGEEFMQVLYTAAALLKVCVSNIEARHASVRRMLTARSVQTTPMGLSELSAQWYFQQFRTGQSALRHGHRGRRAKGRQLAKKKAKRVKKTATAAATQKRRNPGFGGAYRAWMRLKAKDYTDDRGKLDHTALARAYYVARDAGAEDYDRAVRIGSAATQVGRMGRSCGFGKSAKQQRRQADKVRKWSAALHLRNFASDSASRALALGSPTFAGGCSTAEAVAIARRAMSLGRQEADVIEEDLVTALAQFQSDDGGLLQSQLQRMHCLLCGHSQCERVHPYMVCIWRSMARIRKTSLQALKLLRCRAGRAGCKQGWKVNGHCCTRH